MVFLNNIFGEAQLFVNSYIYKCQLLHENQELETNMRIFFFYAIEIITPFGHINNSPVGRWRYERISFEAIHSTFTRNE